jgi:geranylgeranyl diphosphate synthase type I
MTQVSTRGNVGLLQDYRGKVDDFLGAFLAGKRGGEYGPHLELPLRVIEDFLAGGGKRLRPMYCYCGWLAAGGDPTDERIVRVGAAEELFHTFALMHDDLIDAADLRRGQPTAHRAVEEYLPRPWMDQWGEKVALLVGDLCAVFADELFGMLDGRAREMLDRMRTELVIGQYLDLLATDRGAGTVPAALAAVMYKTAAYTVQRPLHIGAAAAGASDAVISACTDYALPLGEAFQLCDDLEDVVEDPSEPGYVGSDLREGKTTTVIAIAVRDASPAQRQRLLALLGDPGLDARGAAEARSIIAATGAVTTVVDMITRRRDQALRSLRSAPFPPEAAELMEQLALRAVQWPS